MSKDISIEKLDLQSSDLVNQNFEKLAALFPNCVTENKEGKAIDFDLLKQELNHAVVDGNKERYRLEWPGKREAIVAANLPTSKTLRPIREDSVNFDTTENLYIEGDNLEVLKLLQEGYLGKIKMIYIDPPYNTGKDFVYKDNFTGDKERELFESGQKDENNRRLVANPETAGRYHSDWLSMMYPRLKLARNLLTTDGVIFISIDDNEIHNLRKICDDIYGENNFIGQIIIKSNPRGSQSKEKLASLHEYLIVYSRDVYEADIVGHALDERMTSEYKLEDSDGKNYRLLGLRQRGGFWRRTDRPSLYYPIYVNPENSSISLEKNLEHKIEIFPIQPTTGEDGSWRWGKDKFINQQTELIAKEVNREGKLVWDIFQKDFINKGEDLKRTKAKSIWDEKKFNYQNGTVELKELIGSGIFDYSKPIELVKSCLEMIDMNDSICLDFFSGSGTSAHAIMDVNSAFYKKIRFLVVQLPEDTEEKSEAFKAGFKNICEIGKERIRRAAKKIKERSQADIDYGFRVYRLDDSNMQDVYYKPQDYNQGNLDLFADNVKPDRTADDLLAQVMLDWGLPLSLEIKQNTINGKKLFMVSENSLYACFDKGIDEDFAKIVAKDSPLRIVFRDSGFKDDTAKTNVKQLLKQLSPETEMKVI